MTVDLRFVGALGPQPGGAVVLLFGSTGTPPPDPPTEPPAGLLRAAVAAAWRRAAEVAPSPAAAPWRRASTLGDARVAPWRAAAPVRGVSSTGWAATGTVGPVAVVAPWRFTLGRQTSTRAPWSSAQALQRAWLTSWRGAAPAAGHTSLAWRAGRGMPTPVRAPWQAGRAVRVLAGSSARDGQRSTTWALAPWQTGRSIESYGGPWTPFPITPVAPVPCYLPDPGNAVTMLFREALTGLAALVFACRRAAIAFVPVRRVYMVTNVTTLVRVSDGTNIPCFGMSLSLDVDSWAWGFSASLPADALTLIEPGVDGEPVELEASVNGTAFRVIAESLSRERVFGQSGLRVQGRGKTAVLDAPYSAIQAFSEVDTLTSQQLLDQALPAGWTADWGLTAWLVPGGIWSHQGTPASAAVAIAAAGGGYVQPHASASSISVLPRYPVAPWNWGTVSPDVELPAAVATREAIDWLELPRYNAVHVSGTAVGGLQRMVKRAGTAGDLLAPMVADPLITHVDAARQRGLAVLARTGRWAEVTLRLPVLPATGVIRPGQFVRYVDGVVTRLGLVRSVSVDVAFPEVWQSIKLETFVS